MSHPGRCPKPHFIFWLNPKNRSKKDQGYFKKAFLIIFKLKCGRVIFEQVLNFPVLLKLSSKRKLFFKEADDTQRKNQSHVFLKVYSY